ncbi:MAG: TolC family protein [Pseudohongiellaceae bacterium]
MQSLLFLRIATLCFGVAIPSLLFADPPSVDDDRLRPEPLAEDILQRNPGLTALDAAVREATARQEGAGRLDDPELAWDTAPGLYTGDAGRAHNIRFSQRIPWPGTLERRYRQSGYRADERRHRLDAARLDIRALALTAWAEWAFVHEALAVTTEHQQTLADLREVVEARYAAGTALQQDVLRVEQENSRVEHERVRYQRQKRAVQARINALLDRGGDAPLPPPSDMPALSPPPLAPESPASVIRQHPVLEQFTARISRAETGVELARLQGMPSLQMRTGYNSLWQMPEQRWTVGITLSVPLDRHRQRAREDEAEARRIRNRMEFDEARRQLEQDLVATRAAVEEGWHVIRLYEDRLLPLARDTFSAARTDYRSGREGFLNVMEAERERLRAEIQLVRAKADYLGHLAVLDRLASADPTTGSTATGGENNE